MTCESARLSTLTSALGFVLGLTVACAHRESWTLWDVTNSSLEILLHRLDTYQDRAACERALAVSVLPPPNAKAPPGWRWERLPAGWREVGPSGDDVVTHSFSCQEGDRRPGEIR